MTIELKIRLDILETRPLALTEELASGKLYGEPVVLLKALNTGVHFVEFEGKSYRFDLMNIVAALGAELKKSEA